MMIKRIFELMNRVVGKTEEMDRFEQIQKATKVEGDRIRLLIGELLARKVCENGIYGNIHNAEFKVFSQFGDDGIIQYLVEQIQPEVKIFIEFGVENYTEANTRFLLMNNNWCGLIIDGNPVNIDFVRKVDYFWRYDLQAVSQFVDRENINSIFEAAGFIGEIGLLSIDIDGNDYWVWESIDSVDPAIVVVEYNSIFGPDHAITIPYDPTFYRAKAHYSNLFWGCSLKALCVLADKKGYAFVGSNSAGNNAYFVRKDKVGKIPVLTCDQGFVESRFRESRDINGDLTFLASEKRIEAIKEMKVVDIQNNKLISLCSLFNLN